MRSSGILGNGIDGCARFWGAISCGYARFCGAFLRFLRITAFETSHSRKKRSRAHPNFAQPQKAWLLRALSVRNGAFL
jgi:hypothetical protein